MTTPLDYSDVDGLVTDEPGLCLTTFYADCVPLFFLDPVKKVIGLSHSGWRGTVGKIGKKTVEVMRSEYGCHPEDILAAIGPSICQTCYEVSGVVKPFPLSFDVTTRIFVVCVCMENTKLSSSTPIAFAILR